MTKGCPRMNLWASSTTWHQWSYLCNALVLPVDSDDPAQVLWHLTPVWDTTVPAAYMLLVYDHTRGQGERQ